MAKDLSYLNSRWWYRLLKVVYVGLTLILTVTVIVLVFHSYPKLPNFEKNYATCADGRVIYPMQYRIFAIDQPYSSSEEDTKLRQICANTINSNVHFTPAQKNYVFTVIYYPRHWGELIGNLILTLVIAAALFEGIRRLFYYISLGTFRPHKKYDH